MVPMLLQVKRMPMLGVGDAENEVNHFCAAPLDLRDCLWWSGMKSAFRVGRVRRPLLLKYAGSVGNCVADRSAELPEDLTERLLKFFIDDYMLVHTEVFMWQLRESRNTQVGILFPVGG